MPNVDSSPDRPAPYAEAPVAAQYLGTFLKPEMLHIYRQITALRAFQPLVLCRKLENQNTFPFENLWVIPKQRTRFLRRLWQKQILGRPLTISRAEAKTILGVMAEDGAELLHVYFGHMGVQLLPLLEILPEPAIVSFHGADIGIELGKPRYIDFTRRMFAKAALLLVRSESLGRGLVALGADERKIRLHRTGIPLDEITFQQRQPPTDGSWRCVQACRLIAKKGLATTFRAFAEFARTFPNATLTIAGEGPQLPMLRELAASLGIEQSVEFCGFLPQARLRELYARSHFFLHPSETGPDGDQEGVPNAMLEAMATGLPVVATHHGGIPEAVEDGVSALLVSERDHAALAQAVSELARNAARYAAMSVAAAARVTSQFDLQIQTRLLENYYREALSLSAQELPKRA